VQKPRDPCTVQTVDGGRIMRAFSMRSLPVRVTGVSALLSSRPAVVFLELAGGGCWGEVDGTTAPGKGERRGQARVRAPLRAGRRGEEERRSKRIRCGAVRERLARIRYSCAPAGGNEGGCSALAVVSTGLVWSSPIVATGGPAPSLEPVNKRTFRAQPNQTSPVVQATWRASSCKQGAHSLSIAPVMNPT
jgi:hypothetical protein